VYGSSSVPARPGQDVTVTLAGLGAISGRVVWDDGTPAVGVGVSVARYQGPATVYPPPRMVGSDGRFLFEEVPAMKFGVKVTGDTVVDQTLTAPVEVLAGRTVDVGTLKVSRGSTRRGLVLSGEGTPVPLAHVTLQMGERTYDEVSDDKGAFQVPPMRTDESLKVRAYTREAASGWTEVAPGDQEITVVLAGSGSGTISGLLLDSGRPTEDRLLMLTLGSVTDPNAVKSRYQTTSEPSGRFKFNQVESGQYKLWVRRAHAEGQEWIAYGSVVNVEAARDTAIVFNVQSSEVGR
jgi:hypothetical protein